MPASRKACERCRVQKAKCRWTEQSPKCSRCLKSNRECCAPGKPAPPPKAPVKDPHEVQSNISKPTRMVISSHGIPQWNTSAALSLINLPSSSLPESPQQVVIPGNCSEAGCYLPSADDGYVVMQEYLHDFNSILPLFSAEGLYTLYHDCYSGASGETSLTRIVVYNTMALVHRLRAMSLFASPSDSLQADRYLENCLSQLPKLLMHAPSLRLVQAILTLAILLQTSPERKRAPLIVSIALGLAQDLGYHELTPGDLKSASGAEASNVFCSAFALDTNMCIAKQQPCRLRFADITTAMPTQASRSQPNASASGQAPDINMLALHCSLSAIQTEAIEDLFSAKVRQRPLQLNAEIYDRIMLDLEAWRQSNALCRLDAADIMRDLYQSEIIHSVMLQGPYFRTLYQLQATNILVQFEKKIDVFSVEILQAMLELDVSLCYEDAMSFLKLIVLVPQGNLSVTWGSMQAIIAALFTVLSSLMRSAQPRELGSLFVCEQALTGLGVAVEHGLEPAYVAAVELCRGMYMRAKS